MMLTAIHFRLVGTKSYLVTVELPQSFRAKLRCPVVGHLHF